VGKPYDPMACEILGVVDGTDENDGLVTEELQKGFYYGDKILRPARVKIAKKKAVPAPEPEPPQEDKPEEDKPEEEGR
jgi:molecular chaperone GrpE